MNDDEQFAQSLRAQATRVAPRIDVDVTHVVPAARRRRAARAGGVTLALGLALGGGAWAATTLERPALPGGAMTMQVEPSPEPSGPPITSSEGDRLIDESSNRPENPVVPPERWRDATYYYVVTSSTTTKQGEEDDESSSLGIERWYGDGVSFDLLGYGPDLLDAPDYLNLGHTPSTNVSFTWAELAELPTEPDALHDALLDAYEPAGEGEEAVLYAAKGLISEAPSSPQLRAAAWQLLTSLPGVDVEADVRDSDDRPGTAATFEVFDGTWTLVYDEEQNVPLETDESMGKIHSRTLYLVAEFTDLPDEIADGILEVPDFTAMTREDAEVACLQKHLACTFEEVRSDTVPEGTVISSDPTTGALFSWGATVTIRLSTGP
jgi:hypothetical protein